MELREKGIKQNHVESFSTLNKRPINIDQLQDKQSMEIRELWKTTLDKIIALKGKLKK